MGSSVPGFFSKQNKKIYKYKLCIFIKKKTKKQNKIMCDNLQRKNNPLRAFNWSDWPIRSDINCSVHR